MTEREFAELYDSLYYGHEAELVFSGRHYFLEWSNSGIEIYLMINGEGTKIASIFATEKSEVIEKLFEFMFGNRKNLNNSFPDFEIVDIE